MCISIIILIIIGFAVLNSYSGQWEVFTGKNEVQDIAHTENSFWAATAGGVVAWILLIIPGRASIKLPKPKID